MKKFLGALYDDKTATYRFSDGSAVYPLEMQIEVTQEADGMEYSGLRALGVLWDWKSRIDREQP